MDVKPQQKRQQQTPLLLEVAELGKLFGVPSENKLSQS